MANILKLKNMLMLSPMAGFTDAPMRGLCKKYGCDVTVTEMVSARALAMENERTKELLICDELDSNSGFSALQLFGSEPISFMKALDREETKIFDIVDINMGCPMPKIVKNGDGSALMLDFKRAGVIIKACKRAKKPVSVKFRTGIEDNTLAVDFAKNAIDSGVDILVLHGRCAKQMYSGSVDYKAIESVAKVASGKVIFFGNGDVTNVESYKRMLNCGVENVAIGRGALGNEGLFGKLKGNDYNVDLLEDMLYHYNGLKQYLPQRVAINEFKKHLPHYLRGKRGSREMVNELMTESNQEVFLEKIKQYLIKDKQG